MLELVRNPLPFSSDRVSLRRFSPGDLTAFQTYRHDAELGRFQGWSSQSDREALQFIVEMAEAPLFLPDHWNQLVIEDVALGSMVGDLGIFTSKDGQQAEIGFTLSRQAQGVGLATQATRLAISLIFESTAVQQILGITDTRNLASAKLLERVGMRRRETRSGLFKGLPCQEYVYAISRQDAGHLGS